MNIKEKNQAFNLLYPDFKKDIFTNDEEKILNYVQDQNFLNNFNLYKNHILLLAITNSPNQKFFNHLLEKDILSIHDLLEIDPNNKKNILLNLIHKNNISLLNNVLLKFPHLISESILNKNLLAHAYCSYNEEMIELLQNNIKKYEHFIDLSSSFQYLIDYPEHVHFYAKYYIEHKKHFHEEQLPISLFQDEHKKSFNILQNYILENKDILFSNNNISLVSSYLYNCIRYDKKKAIIDIFPILNNQEKESLFNFHGFEIAKKSWFYDFSLKNNELLKINNILFTYKLYEHTEIVYELMKQNVHNIQQKNYYNQSFLSSWLTDSYYHTSSSKNFNLDAFNHIIQEFPLALGEQFLIHFLDKHTFFSQLYQDKGDNIIFTCAKNYLSQIDNTNKEVLLLNSISYWINQYLSKNNDSDINKKQFQYDYLEFLSNEYSKFNKNPFYHFSNLPKKISKLGDITLFKIILKYNPEFNFSERTKEKNLNIIKSTTHTELKHFIKILTEKEKLNQLLEYSNDTKRKMKI